MTPVPSQSCSAGPTPGPSRSAQPVPFAWGQFAAISAAAVAIFLGLRLLPIGTNLNHMDFRVDPKGGQALEFCDPANPQFIPVVAMRSPVAMTLATAAPAVAGQPVPAVITLRTASGKAIAPEDLLVTHTRRLHLLLVDPALADYQHLHPEPARTPGQWTFTFTPRRSGAYRVFADFTPAATARGLYASVDLEVAAPAGVVAGAAAADDGARRVSPTEVEHHGHRFGLAVSPQPARAGQPMDLRFSVRRIDGGEVGLGEVMDAYAHLVAFDVTRSGFAHLHPVGEAPPRPPDRVAPVLNFKLTIPQPGSYTIWAQINLRGREEFVPFALEVK
jgi:hypothetical protein